MMKYLNCLLIFAILVGSCNNDEPKGLLTEKKMRQVFADIMKVQAYSKNYLSKDSQKNIVVENAKMQLQVFALHKVTKEEFYNSYNYYMTKPKKIEPIFDSVITKINNEKYSRTALSKDSNKVRQVFQEK